MINSTPPQASTLGSEDERVDAVVIALWFAFYLFVFLPRSV